MKALAIATAPAVGIVLMAGPASAAPRCNYTAEYNACIEISKTSSGKYLLHLGIDLRKLSKQEAQTIINASRYLFKAELWGSDGGEYLDDFQAYIPVQTRVWASTESGLSADIDSYPSSHALNEDLGGGDELYAKIISTDPRTGAKRTFKTPEFFGFF
ncbi:hypothetical protein Aple_072330 [Acrocarpospora pleiomorpha]|uniref:Uncharacterized protein n=2 Tax=Acrocarpospora pleiomorpha TaxID=90975 RepID=A0A5M3XSR0_9ACTN|nr:hypothetical protein Aple_072330 [Acrocarpospora pleiomorpha]